MKIPEDVLKDKGIEYYQKYPYGELARVTKNHKRHYETPDGRQVPSVTTVLSATKDMTFLHAWRKRIGVEKAQQITTESANIGTVMHYLQLVAYSEAHNKQYGTNIKNGRMFICTQANEYQSFEIENYDMWVGKWYGKLEEYYKLVL